MDEARAQSATVEEQSDVIAAALARAVRRGWITHAQEMDADAMRFHHAYLDAVLVMMPEGWTWTAGNDEDLPGVARLHCAVPGPESRPINISAQAATPALALLAAIERSYEHG